MIWDPKHECMPIEQRRKLQLLRLREQLARLWTAVPLYRERWRDAGILPAEEVYAL